MCPYVWDTPGGVQAHVHDIAETLISEGHEVSVLAPVDDPETAALPSYVVAGGRTVPVPYNGSVARLCFGPVSLARMPRDWSRRRRTSCFMRSSRFGRSSVASIESDALSASTMSIPLVRTTLR